MSRSCLWGVRPSRRLVFWALLFSSIPPLLLSLSWFFHLYWCWLITGTYSSCHQHAAVSAAAVEHLHPPRTTSSSFSSFPHTSSSLGKSRERRWKGRPGYICVLMKQWRAGVTHREGGKRGQEMICMQRQRDSPLLPCLPQHPPLSLSPCILLHATFIHFLPLSLTLTLSLLASVLSGLLPLLIWIIQHKLVFSRAPLSVYGRRMRRREIREGEREKWV